MRTRKHRRRFAASEKLKGMMRLGGRGTKKLQTTRFFPFLTREDKTVEIETVAEAPCRATPN